MQTSDRWLICDQRTAFGTTPGTHAFLVGVSAYRYLQDTPTLSTAARSAYVFANWLLNTTSARAVRPLKTLRLLLAPSQSEQGDIDSHIAGDCLSEGNFDEFVSAAYAWKDDASVSPKDLALFYFCGKGFELGPSDPVLAFADYRAPRSPSLRGTVSVNHLVQGLSPSEFLPEVARTQLFLIDAPRERLSFDRRVTAPPVWDLAPSKFDDRLLTVCQASSPGEKTWAVLGGTTIFLSALMRCLHGAAAVRDITPTNLRRSGEGWKVTVNSLAQALPNTVAQVCQEAGAPAQRVSVSATTGDVDLVRLSEPPLVPVTVQFKTTSDAARAELEIRNADNVAADVAEGGRESDRRHLILPAGLYSVRISFRAPDPNQADQFALKSQQFLTSVVPPLQVWQVEAKP